MTSKFAQQILKSVLVLPVILFSSFHIANAAVPATCDPAYWDAMKSKAWMEAQREISQNQNLIYKADSVLEYTCYDEFLKALGGNAGSMFSETQMWGSNPMVGGDSMDQALGDLVYDSLTAYLSGSFGHTLLGGRMSDDYTPSGASGSPGYTYSCDIMQKVWQAARCMNFNDQADIDDFFDLTKYDGWDPRSTIPAGFTCSANPNWAAAAQKATNDPVAYQEQPVAANVNLISAPKNCSGDSCCPTPPVKTGIKIGSGDSSRDEFVCSNPGCAYDYSASKCTTEALGKTD